MSTISRKPLPAPRRPVLPAGPTSAAMATALAASWLSMLAHNLSELPLTLLDWENSGPLLIDVALFGAFWSRRASRLVATVILGWALLNLVIGGVITVLPLPVLPFVPEQSVNHYLVHAVYVAGQIPLALLAWSAIRRSANTGASI